MVSFSQLTDVNKKDTIFGAARKIFGPSYFMTTLEDFENYHRPTHSGLELWFREKK